MVGGVRRAVPWDGRRRPEFLRRHPCPASRVRSEGGQFRHELSDDSWTFGGSFKLDQKTATAYIAGPERAFLARRVHRNSKRPNSSRPKPINGQGMENGLTDVDLSRI
jgi:hypothetical protein